MKPEPRILVATDTLADADLVRKLLQAEFDHVFISTDPDRAVEDFEKHRPDVLVLAFDELEKSERYYLGLYRLSKNIHGQQHRTVILCNKDNVRRVYDLCKREHFDDYVLFWPLTQDFPRLLMATRQAARLLDAETNGPTVGEFAAQARRLGAIQPMLEEHAARGGEQILAANRSLQQARKEIDLALEGDRTKQQEIAAHLSAVSAAMQPVEAWAGTLQSDLLPKFEPALTLHKMVAHMRPLALLVDDDEFQHKLLRNLLRDVDLEIVCTMSADEAFALLRKRRPDVILMDVDLPDINGVEITRRIKAADRYAAIPILMITGHSDKSVVMQSMKAGAAGLVVKPFNRETLLAKVRACLTGGVI